MEYTRENGGYKGERSIRGRAEYTRENGVYEGERSIRGRTEYTRENEVRDAKLSSQWKCRFMTQAGVHEFSRGFIIKAANILQPGT